MPGIFGSGGSSGPTETQVSQTTTNLPEYARPYYEDLLARAGYQSSLPYQPYGGQRLAYFSPAEQEAMARLTALGTSGTSPELNQAGIVANSLTQGWDPGITGGITSSYNPSGFSSSYSPGSVGTGYSADTRNSGYTAGTYNPSYTADTRNAGYFAGQLDPNSNYDGGQYEVGFEPGSLADKDVLQTYADPYYQAVVETQKREAARQADMRNSQIGLESAGIGSLGGYREAIIRAENERNLGYLQNDIQAAGSENAYLNAQQAFEADRSARALREQFGQSAFGMNEQVKQRMTELMQQGFSVNEAARQAQEQFAQSQFGMNSANRQAQEQFSQSAFGMNSANQQAQEQFAQSQFGMNSANQQAQAQFMQNAFAMNQQAQQFGANLQLQAYQASEAAMQEAARLGLSAAQINLAGQIASANILLNQNQNQLQAAGMLGDFTAQRQQMELERLNALGAVGTQQRQLAQQALDIGYQDFLRQQAYPMEQLGLLSNILQGQNIQPGQTQTIYGAQPSAFSQLAGTGLAGLGLYNATKP